MKQVVIQTLSIAAPAYNEAAGIEAVTAEWIAYLRTQPTVPRFEIVICNDGSRDRTGAILEEIRAASPEMRPVHHSVNQGAAAALTTAIRHTSGDWVLLLDSDGQFPVQNLPRMLAAIEEGTLAVTGARTAKRDSAFAQIGSALSGRLCNWFHGTHYRDFNCALKLVRGDILRSLPLEARGLNYSGEITSKLLERGVAPVEVEVEHRDRKAGVSSARRIRSAVDRLLFVLYIGFRQFLIRQAVLQGKLQRSSAVSTEGFRRTTAGSDSDRVTSNGAAPAAAVWQAVAMLDTADLRRHLSALFEADAGEENAILRCLEYRIPQEFSIADAKGLEAYVDGRPAPGLGHEIRALFDVLGQCPRIAVQYYLKGFFDEYRSNAVDFQFAGRPLGSLVLTGALLKSNRDFTRSVHNLARVFIDRAETIETGRGDAVPELNTQRS